MRSASSILNENDQYEEICVVEAMILIVVA